jgi:hypothetical protein
VAALNGLLRSQQSINQSINQSIQTKTNQSSKGCLAELVDDPTKAGWMPTDYLQEIDESSKQSNSLSFASSETSSETTNTDGVDGLADGLSAASLHAAAAAGAIMCHACGAAVGKQFVVAKDKTFHVDHFCCCECKSLLSGMPFIEREGAFYCEADFYELFNPKCGGCGETIQVGSITRSLASVNHYLPLPLL